MILDLRLPIAYFPLSPIAKICKRKNVFDNSLRMFYDLTIGKTLFLDKRTITFTLLNLPFN